MPTAPGAAGRDLDDFLSAATEILSGTVDSASVTHRRADSDVLDLHDTTTAEDRFRGCGPLDSRSPTSSTEATRWETSRSASRNGWATNTAESACTATAYA